MGKMRRTGHSNPTKAVPTDRNLAPKIRRNQNISLEHWLVANICVSTISSNVNKIKFDPGDRKLWVEFHGGRVGYYQEVDSEVARKMFISTSMGKYVHEVLIARNFLFKWDKGTR